MSEKLTEQTVVQFLDALASSAPAPGGGSVAALSGALGAALVSMVCNLTLGKSKYASVQDDITELVAQSEELRQRLTDLLEADVRAYTGVSRAYQMPRQTAEEKAARSAAIQEALKAATQAPMQVAETCVEVLDLCAPAAEKCNINAVKDEAFRSAMQDKLDALLAGKPALKDQVYDLVVEKL